MSLKSMPVAKFRLGRLVSTATARERLAPDDILSGIRRHQAGDWGEAEIRDRAANDLALRDGTRLFSIYRSAAGLRFYIITEADRSSTTILLPEEY